MTFAMAHPYLFCSTIIICCALICDAMKGPEIVLTEQEDDE